MKNIFTKLLEKIAKVAYKFFEDNAEKLIFTFIERKK